MHINSVIDNVTQIVDWAFKKKKISTVHASIYYYICTRNPRTHCIFE